MKILQIGLSKKQQEQIKEEVALSSQIVANQEMMREIQEENRLLFRNLRILQETPDTYWLYKANVERINRQTIEQLKEWQVKYSIDNIEQEEALVPF